jgi:AAA domain-containing protein
VKRNYVKLILVDTLSAFWRIENENDAAEMTKVMKPLLQLARESGACVLLNHHARKSEGSYGDEIRGSGALFALVDVAIMMKRYEVQTQRLLQFQSRYPETPSELVVELRESGYVALGDPASVSKTARLAKLTATLSDQWEETEVIAKRATLSQRECYRLLNLLVGEGKALRDGKGKKGSPYRFKQNAIHAGGQSIGHESKSTKIDSIHATPPSPCTNGNPFNETEEEIDLAD